MRLRYPTTAIYYAILSFFFACPTLASPAINTLSKDSETFLLDSSTPISISISISDSDTIFQSPSLLEPRGTAKGNYIIVRLEPGIHFQTCAPNLDDPTMCTLAYVERSTWGGWGSLWVYDNACNLQGENDHVARNWLAKRWSLSSLLPWTVDIKITNIWTEDHSKGVEIWYGKNHIEPFWEPMHPWLAYRARYEAKNNTKEHYAVFRAPFPCD